MDQFFTPTRRLQSVREEYRHFDVPVDYAEVQLAVPVEDFLIYRWTWADLRAFTSGGARQKIVWITEDTFLSVDGGAALETGHDEHSALLQAYSTAPCGGEQSLVVWTPLVFFRGYTTSLPTGACSIFWRAITTSNIVKLTIRCSGPSCLSSGPVLSQFLGGSPSLKYLEFVEADFGEEHCRALATLLERTDLAIVFRGSRFLPQGAQGAFIEWLRSNQVVTDIHHCDMETSILSALSGNTSVKRLSFDAIRDKSDEKHVRSLIEALPTNQGLELLALNNVVMSDETWVLLFRSLSTHNTMKSLSLIGWRSHLSAESKTTRMRAILQMLQHNTVMRTIQLSDDFTEDEEMYQSSILPRLEMNRNSFEVQRRAVKRADLSIRAQLLGRALHAVRYNPDLVFRFLSENVPAFVRSEDDDNDDVGDDAVTPSENDPTAFINSGQKRKTPP
jgi:hypothetical protein